MQIGLVGTAGPSNEKLIVTMDVEYDEVAVNTEVAPANGDNN